jgi:threonine-phosphate decarboxylase
MHARDELAVFDMKAHNPPFAVIRAATRYAGELVDFCVPVNRYFPPQELVDLIHDNLPSILKYYPDYASAHQRMLAELTGLPAPNLVVSNGSTEIITAICCEAQEPILTSIPTFGRWTDLPMDLGIPMRFIHRRKCDGFRIDVDQLVHKAMAERIETLVICNPNNPTGVWLAKDDIAQLIRRLRHLHRIVIDESFIDFSDLGSAADLAIQSSNTIIVKSMGKALGWHGVRLGYAVTNLALAQAMRLRIPYWNVNGLASFVLQNMLRFKDAYRQSFARVIADRDYMQARLGRVRGLTVYPSKANFIYCELPHRVSGKLVRDRLLEEHGMVVRECSNKLGSSDAFMRLAVNRRDEVDRLARALERVLPALS